MADRLDSRSSERSAQADPTDYGSQVTNRVYSTGDVSGIWTSGADSAFGLGTGTDTGGKTSLTHTLTVSGLPEHTKAVVSVDLATGMNYSATDQDIIKVSAGGSDQSLYFGGTDPGSGKWDAWFDSSSSSLTITISAESFEYNGEPDQNDSATVYGVAISVYTPHETDWVVTDPAEALYTPTSVTTTSGSVSGSAGFGITYTRDWTRQYFVEDFWVVGGSDASGSWGAAADVDITVSYETSKELGAKAGITLPIGISGTVSGSITATVGTSAHFGLSLGGPTDPDSQYDITLKLRKRKVYYIETSILTVSTSSGTQTMNPTTSGPVIASEGYVSGNHDWIVKKKTRESVPV